MNKFFLFVSRLMQEPPFRLITRQFVKWLPVDLFTKAQWDVTARPHYLVGLLRGAIEARAAGITEFCAIEFGVAAGNGLLALQDYAIQVERATGIKIKLYGFDTGTGLPNLCGDYRDHPDLWQPADYPMNEAWLRSQLSDRTKLILGNVSETVRKFVDIEQDSPVGFVAFDLDMYSSTMDAFELFRSPRKKMMKRIPLYFDDCFASTYHKFAGEYLAIEEFNQERNGVVIDKWYNIKANRPFPENIWTEKMYIAHDLNAISLSTVKDRPPLNLAGT